MIVDKKKKDKETNNKPPTKASPKVVKENGKIDIYFFKDFRASTIKIILV